ncbi:MULTISPECIES: PLP-dependent aminotransferase family protein [unclassified Acidovorax]|jgi:DNA-binding transcriptional MocR family regulator|uniref:aminotransferase-like domain-containing protein n=1 Tax=unclassified Acidovorax TaxID=2684926 RepID=UPI000BD21B18|nr:MULTISPECIES: PLP-dependent aminotransferase family protein [unclassified Acidovorax]OZA53883.1 MAG: aspartate aminotransferase [Acidovorax sp. 17-64-282]HQS20343.1 PLP-dependent aminotransferase family protein [Acidovorax defluvii]OYY28551.1 MAG: aspartate aminotransferase [Acidovorax sp. 35-64-16]OYY87779.1 MAG: aspartate aminotransferase [Acidovorax sp. 28-64-14]OYZ46951.1 MAG: aspartate aminotransferase [Acidovorax sp. 16-64-162]
MQFADRLNNVETSAIRELFKLLGKPGIISFAGGFPDSAMFDVEGIRAASNAALAEEPGAALQYGATEGYNPLREQLAAFMTSKGAKEVAADNLIVTTGSQQALDLLGKTLISPGDKVIVEGPTFLATIQCFRLYGAELISAPIDGNGVKTDELEKLIAEHKPKFVYLIPTFGNPSGAMLSLARRKQVLEMAVKHNTLIVEDDPYGDLYFGDAPPPSLLNLSATVPGSRELLVHCGSLSKVLSPGLRVGWMIAPAELLGKATMCKQFSDAHTSTFAQATAAQYLKAGRMPARLANVRKVYAERAQAMGDALRKELGDAIEFVQPQGGLFVWARLTGAGGKVADGNVLAKRAIEKGVAFVPGTPFFCANPDHATFRLSFATADADKIREGVARLAQAL